MSPLARIGALLAAASLVSGVTYASAASVAFTSQTFTPYQTCILTAYPSSTTGESDANVKQASPTSNFGSDSTLTASSSLVANQRIYLRFDLTRCTPAIPTTATVRLATLRLFVTALSGACRTEDIFAVAAA